MCVSECTCIMVASVRSSAELDLSVPLYLYQFAKILERSQGVATVRFSLNFYSTFLLIKTKRLPRKKLWSICKFSKFNFKHKWQEISWNMSLTMEQAHFWGVPTERFSSNFHSMFLSTETTKLRQKRGVLSASFRVKALNTELDFLVPT